MLRFSYVVLAVWLLAGVSAAQSPISTEVFGGFSYVNKDFSLASPNSLKGWNASATFNDPHHIGVVFDFSGFYPSGGLYSAKVHTFLIGPQVWFRVKRVTPFARFLIGDTNVQFTTVQPFGPIFTSPNSLTYAAGGGVDYSLTHLFAIRGQVDWLHTRFQTVDDQVTQFLVPNVVRISTGLVVKF